MSHWSKTFGEPARSNQMSPTSGMSSGIGKPNISRVKYHAGVLWFSGAWEADKNVYWFVWCYSTARGWWPVAWQRAGSKDGVSPGEGPDGRVCDFVWDNDGNMFCAGQFTRIRNGGGTEYEGINALCMLHNVGPYSQSVNKWRPVGTWHANGTVSHQGSLARLAWDPQRCELYAGGNFSGIPGKMCFNIVRYKQRKNKYKAVGHGTYSTPGSAHQIDDILLDFGSCDGKKRPRVYVTGIFKFAGGPKGYPDETFWSRMVSYWDWSAKDWQKIGGGKEFDKICRGFIQAGNPQGRALLLDSTGQLWVGGGYTSSTLPGIAGIARWNGSFWSDPTGRGGFNRDVFAIVEQLGRVYVVGAFSAFADGTPAMGVAVFDLSSGTWAALDEGLSGVSMPGHFDACAAPDGDVYFAGDFRQAGAAGNQSFYVAQYSPQRDIPPPAFKFGLMVKQPTAPGKNDGSIEVKAVPGVQIQVGFNNAKPSPKALFSRLAPGNYALQLVAAGAMHNLQIPLEIPGMTGTEVAPGAERWSLQFPKPANTNSMNGKTGMSDGVGMPDIRDVQFANGAVFFAGDWQAKMGQGHWNVWRWHPVEGWGPIAFHKSQRAEQGPNGIIERIRLYQGRLYCCGAFKEVGNVVTKGPVVPALGVGVFDLATGVWSALDGTFKGKPVNGYIGTGGVVHDIAFDLPEKGDVLLGGSFTGLTVLDKSVQSWGVHVRHANGEFAPMGKGIYTDPDKPNEVRAICADYSKNPPELYIGGGFVYAGGDGQSHTRNRCHSVARWDRAQKNWVRIGEPGEEGQMLERHQTVGMGTWVPDKCVVSAFPVVRDMTCDRNGRLYVGGALGMPQKGRRAFVIARWNGNSWEDPTDCEGLSRDIYRFAWNSSGSVLYMSGAFQMNGRLEPIGLAAQLDIASGKLSGLGGSGLTGKTFPVTACSSDGDALYVGGMFTHAGRPANLLAAKPQQSYYVAKWQ